MTGERARTAGMSIVLLLAACIGCTTTVVRATSDARFDQADRKIARPLSLYLDQATRSFECVGSHMGSKVRFQAGDALFFNADTALKTVFQDVTMTNADPRGTPSDGLTMVITFGPGTRIDPGASTLSRHDVEVELRATIYEHESAVWDAQVRYAAGERAPASDTVAALFVPFGGYVAQEAYDQALSKAANETVAGALDMLRKKVLESRDRLETVSFLEPSEPRSRTMPPDGRGRT